MNNLGGYDDGYRKCKCFWGTEPGSLVKMLSTYVKTFVGIRVLDAGCGEGKNAVYLANLGATVIAVDISASAIKNAREQWPNVDSIDWVVGDVQDMSLPTNHYDVVLAYGLLHCFEDEQVINTVVKHLQASTKANGINIVCSFNDRKQELSAHPGFSPTLLTHAKYIQYYDSWKIRYESDSDLTETHPHNGIEHSHSLTRIIAQKVFI